MTAIETLNHVCAAEQAGRDGAMIENQIDLRVEPAGSAGRQRLASLDFIRGIAVMGVPAANIVAFGARGGVRLAAFHLGQGRRFRSASAQFLRRRAARILYHGGKVKLTKTSLR